MPKTLGSRRALPVLRERRSAQGMSLAEFGAAVERQAPFISMLETGKQRASLELQHAIAIALDGEIDELFAPVEETVERPWLSIHQAATEAAISFETVAAAIAAGELPDEANSDRAGGAPHQIPREAFDIWLARRHTAAELLSLSIAARRFGFSRETLRAAADARRVRHADTFPDRRGRRRYRFDAADLRDDLAGLPVCSYGGCDERALHPNGACTKHSAIIATPRGHSATTRSRIAAALRGKPKSDEHRRRLSEACLGRPSPRRGARLSSELRSRISASLSGRRLTDAHRTALSDAARERHATHPETFPQKGMDPDRYARWGVSRYVESEWGEQLHAKGRAGRLRQRWLGRRDAAKPPGSDAPPRGRPRVIATATQAQEIRQLAASGWGRRAIASRLRVGERLVRNVLETP